MVKKYVKRTNCYWPSLELQVGQHVMAMKFQQTIESWKKIEKKTVFFLQQTGVFRHLFLLKSASSFLFIKVCKVLYTLWIRDCAITEGPETWNRNIVLMFFFYIIRQLHQIHTAVWMKRKTGKFASIYLWRRLSVKINTLIILEDRRWSGFNLKIGFYMSFFQHWSWLNNLRSLFLYVLEA